MNYITFLTTQDADAVREDIISLMLLALGLIKCNLLCVLKWMQASGNTRERSPLVTNVQD